MKTFILDLWKKAKTFPFYFWIWISLPVVIFILSTLFGDVASRHPKGIVDTIIFLLMVAFLAGWIILLNVPKRKDVLSSPNAEKSRRIRKSKKLLQIKIFGRYHNLRPILFILLGILCSLYWIFSMQFFNEIEEFNKIFRICTFLFIPVYPLVYYIITITFFKSKEDDDLDLNGGTDITMYVVGLFAGAIIFMILSLISLILFGLFWIGKGIVWLTENTNSLGVIIIFVIIGMVLVSINPKKSGKSNKSNP